MHITNLISQYFGKFAKKEFPSFFQKMINETYVKIFKIDLSEFRNAKYYKSLTDLFTRELAIPRQIDEAVDSVISPCDSFITQGGNLKEGTLLQIKGMEYSAEELLTYYCTDNYDKVKNGSYINFYLAPSDYHRYHAPVDFVIKKLIHVPGKLYPVNFKYLKKEIELFVQNERVILECRSNEDKLFYMVFVGALNVGQMVFDFEPSVQTNTNTNDIMYIDYDGVDVRKGDTLGYFKMGSTIVMIWEENSIELENLLNQKVKFGQKIATVK
ncbi:phosphatidylserine decarboxylase [Arcobacter sp. CECT 8985]|uniref:phosphatidylserine decarboxylase n=1 Tax=Arcobacter sp. CECT 8985 TaxID=1935424 RepID=UPI00100BCD9D|nr:phosphatidylserine decarboxylase [Arcobacter sp. CECT 8985]RXJ85568.1 phosphatidylserine decarboxylase [Arcobacter sp. CECT 8985]